MISEEELTRLREKYPKGTRIHLIHMHDKWGCRLDGSLGTVDHIDDAGTIHIHWDMGSSLGLIPNEDEFEVYNGED